MDDDTTIVDAYSKLLERLAVDRPARIFNGRATSEDVDHRVKHIGYVLFAMTGYIQLACADLNENIPLSMRSDDHIFNAIKAIEDAFIDDVLVPIEALEELIEDETR